VVTTLGAELLGSPSTALADGTEAATTFSTTTGVAVTVKCTAPTGTGVDILGPGSSEAADYWGLYSEVTNGIGVNATSQNAVAVRGTSNSTAGSTFAIEGVMGSTTPGGFSAAVRGQNNGTGGLGLGVWGSHAGSGWGGYFTSASGIGLNAVGGSGTGVNATGATGVTALGDTIGVAASSTTGRGVVAAGTAAQIQLTPGSAGTHPASGAAGDIYVDSTAQPWFCQGGANWVSLIAGGPQGQAGAQGQPGGQGLAGAQGSAGAQGQTGAQGPAGAPGQPGKTGTLRLIPSSSAHPPRSGTAGELFVDSSHRLWFCKKGGLRASWKQIA
jgi:hypothetical protein